MEKVESHHPAARDVAHRDDAAPTVTTANEATTRARPWWTLAPTLHLVAGGVVIGAVFYWLQFSTRAICCGDFDGYYHIRWSQLLWDGLRQGQFPPAFTWLPLTTLNPQDYVDHHLLFHVLQIPFTWFRDVRLGAKVSAALFAGLAVFSCYWLVVRHRVSYPLVWLFALLGCSAPFLYRMNMAKAMSVSIVLLIVGIHLLFTRRYVWLLPLAFVFTLTYDMFVLLGVAAALWTAVLLWSERRLHWQPPVYVGAGILTGLIINPYFPKNVQLLAAHVAMKVTATGFSTAVGNEWYPYDSWDFFNNCLLAFVAMFAGYVAFQWREREGSARPLFFLIFSTLLLIANARWRRFAEYWPPFAVLFAAFSLQPLLAGARAALHQLPSEVLNDLQPFLDRQERAETLERERERKRAGLAVASFAGVLLAIWMGFTVLRETREIADSAPPEDYRAGLEWLRRNAPAGQLVFNTDWDDFPKLFYYDPTHAYVSGLDPTYLHDQNPELSKLYEQITLGKEKDPGPLLRDRFGARYVFTDNEEVHDAFYNNALDSGWFDEVYTDEHCTILYVRDQKGLPPGDEVEMEDEGENATEGGASAQGNEP